MGFIEPTAFKWATDSGGKRRKQPIRGSRWKARYRERGRACPVALVRHQDGGAGVPRPHECRYAARGLPRPHRAPPALLGLGQHLVGHHRETAADDPPPLLAAASRPRSALLRSRAMGGIDYVDVEKFIAAKIAEGLLPKKVRDAVSVGHS